MTKLSVVLFSIFCIIYLSVNFNQPTSNQVQFINPDIENNASSPSTNMSYVKPLTSSEDRGPLITKTSTPDTIIERIGKYQKMIPQDILVDLFERPLNSEELIYVLLKLLELGTLEPNEALREGARSSHYTVMYIALLLAKDITPEQVGSLIDAGAYVQNNSAWKRAIAYSKNVKTTMMLIQAGGYGVEDYDYFADKAVAKGNSDMLIALSNNGLFLDNKRVEVYKNSIRSTLKSEVKHVEHRDDSSKLVTLVQDSLSNSYLDKEQEKKLQDILISLKSSANEDIRRSANRIEGLVEISLILSEHSGSDFSREVEKLKSEIIINK